MGAGAVVKAKSANCLLPQTLSRNLITCVHGHAGPWAGCQDAVAWIVVGALMGRDRDDDEGRRRADHVDDVADVAAFLHRSMSDRISTVSWIRAMRVPWTVDAPNHGYLLRSGGAVVGAQVAYYSRREVRGQCLDICNLGAWSVDEEHRLLRTTPAQGGARAGRLPLH